MEINKTHNGTDANNPDIKRSLSHSRVEMHPDFDHTIRFGENSVNLCFDVVPSDEDYQFRCRHHINSYTLKAPLGQNVELHKDYYLVPKQAILPFNAERIVQAPKTGDDVPEDANTVVRNFMFNLSAKLNPLEGSEVPFLTVFKILWFVQTFFSRGSLMNYLGFSPERMKFSLSAQNGVDISSLQDYSDDFFEKVVSDLNPSSPYHYVITMSDGSLLVYYGNASDSTDSNFSSFRDMIYYVLSHISDIQSIVFWNDSSSESFETLYLETVAAYGRGPHNDPFNFERHAAYALVQAHFYTNDNVDYVYNADMLRNYLSSLISTALPNEDKDTFDWNGMKIPYDWLSGHYFQKMFSALSLTENTDAARASLAYFETLFSFRPSLRFVDYFTGAHTRPLAVGEQGVQVNEGFVSAVDMVREIQRSKYLQLVERSGRDSDDYTEAVFGVRPGYDYHDPMWLASTSDSIHSVEVENTGEAQVSEERQFAVTGAFRSNADRYAFRFNSSVYGVVIGIEYVDIKRVYTDVRERSFFVANRYDMFIPEMQFIGDQPIYKQELGIEEAINDPVNGVFGYTARDMQYKVAISRAVGGFDGALPGWAFVMSPTALRNAPNNTVISPDFIRARCTEFDVFYQSLLYNSFSKYFHFIIFQTSDIEIKRPMIMNPQIMQ